MSKDSSWSLVTGGAGFIGSYLCDALLARGEKVICVDNLFTGRKENIQHLLKPHTNFQFIQEDIVHWKWATHQFMSSWDIGVVYNLACPA